MVVSFLAEPQSQESIVSSIAHVASPHDITVSPLTADVDYLAVEVPLLFQINGLNRSCVDITILQDRVTQNEYYEVFLVQLRNPSVAVLAGQVVVVILDQG